MEVRSVSMRYPGAGLTARLAQARPGFAASSSLCTARRHKSITIPLSCDSTDSQWLQSGIFDYSPLPHGEVSAIFLLSHGEDS